MPFFGNVLVSLGIDVLHNRRLAAPQPGHFVSILNQHGRHVIQLTVNFQTDSWITLYMPPPGLTVGKVPVQSESLGTGLQIQRLTAWHKQDANRMRNSIPGAGLHRRGIFSEGIIELIDPVPVRHRLANPLTGQPQSRSC